MVGGESLRERGRDPDTGTDRRTAGQNLKEVQQRPRKRGTETQKAVKETVCVGETKTREGGKEKEKGQKEERQ